MGIYGEKKKNAGISEKFAGKFSFRKSFTESLQKSCKGKFFGKFYGGNFTKKVLRGKKGESGLN